MFRATRGRVVPRRAPRPATTRVRAYRTAVPAAILLLALTTAILLVLASGVLLGLIPYPGK